MRTSARSFPIAIRFQGQDLCFLGTDLVTGWFFAGFPDDMPLTACWQKQRPRERVRLLRQQEVWQNALLSRGVHALLDERWARLTPELVQRLGGTAEGTPGVELVYGYLSGLGWFQPGDDAYRECDLPRPAGALAEVGPAGGEERLALTRIPGRNMLWAVKEVAQRSGTGAHRVWRSWAISDFIWTWRVTLEPELAKERELKAPAASLPPEMAAIGVGD